MSLTALGINHKTAPIAFREQLAFNPERLASALTHARNQGIDNLVILSTCNRTEFFANNHTAERIMAWLGDFLQTDISYFQTHFYHSHANDALTHMIRVASGLDSMILGEPQILGQVKQSVQVATQHGALNKKFLWLFEQIFAATKKIRTDSKLGEQAVSIGFAVAKLASQIFDDLQSNTLLLVAAGEMNALVAKHLCEQGLGKLIICNRSHARAATLKQNIAQNYPLPIEVIGFDQLANHLPMADMVSSCTASMQTVVSYKWVKKAIKARRYKPMLLVDLAVPRDIDEKVAKLDDVFLYAVDDLQHVLEQNLAQRKNAAVNAEVMVSQQVSLINANTKIKDLSHHMANYQAFTHDTSTQLKQKAHAQLANGVDASDVVNELAHQLTAKLTHAQFKLLRQAASQDNPAILNFVLDIMSENNKKT